MTGIFYLALIFIVISIIIVGSGILIINRRKLHSYKIEIEEFDKIKNSLQTSSIPSELAKVETIIKNEKMEENYNNWCDRYDLLKNNNVPKLNDMIIDLDISTNYKNKSDYLKKLVQLEIEVEKSKAIFDKLLDEIKEVTLSEEKYRSIIIKLKTKYRNLNSKFSSNKDEYGEINEIIKLQFENIEKRFKDFELCMEKNEYNEVVHIVKAIDSMVDHIEIVIKEVPDLILLTQKILPKKIEQIMSIYNDMIESGYSLDYLKLEYNIEETQKHINDIVDRIKVLNLEDCMFELKTITEYIECMFKEFDDQKLSRKKYNDDKANFEEKLSKVNKTVTEIYNQLDEIKNTYDLNDDDLKIINDVNDKCIKVNEDYKGLLKSIKNKKIPYSEVVIELDKLNKNLNNTDEELDIALKSLGNMYEDEQRAKEQLDEIQLLLNRSKIRIRSYKLPIITKDYYVQLSEANEAILEIMKELEKRPIVIKTLNTRVDTARDLVLKLYNTTNESIKSAKASESAIIYGNRYRSEEEYIDEGLKQAEMLFYKGEYKNSLDVATRTIEQIETGFRDKIKQFYKKEI